MFIRSERSIGEFIRFYPVIAVIVIINLVVWVLTDFVQLPFAKNIWYYGVGFNPLVTEGEYWRLITPIFLHAGFAHVAFNSFSLVLFGPALERMIGKPLFIISYLVMGIAGNVGTYFLEPLSIIPHVGASTSIYGLLGVFIYMRFFRKDLIDSQSAQLVTTITIIGVIMTFIQPNINIAGHLFGFVGGLIIAPLILAKAKRFVRPIPTHRPKARNPQDVEFDPDRWQNKRRGASSLQKNIIWIILGVLVMIGLIGRFF